MLGQLYHVYFFLSQACYNSLPLFFFCLLSSCSFLFCDRLSFVLILFPICLVSWSFQWSWSQNQNKHRERDVDWKRQAWHISFQCLTSISPLLNVFSVWFYVSLRAECTFYRFWSLHKRIGYSRWFSTQNHLRSCKWKLFGKGQALSKNMRQVIGWTICPSQSIMVLPGEPVGFVTLIVLSI